MRSLRDLNTAAKKPISYNDSRAPGVKFGPRTPGVIGVITNQTVPFKSPVALDIVDIINVTDVAYIIDVSVVPGTTVTWPVIPEGCQVTNPNSGVYKITGITTPAIWQQVKNPTVTQPELFYGPINYNARITYLSTQYETWNITCTVDQVDMFSSVADFVFTPGTDNETFPVPKFVDNLTPQVDWTVTMTPSSVFEIDFWRINGQIGNGVISGLPAQVSVNLDLQKITIIGTSDEINRTLPYIKLRSYGPSENNFTLTYSAVNSVGGSGTRSETLVQKFKNKKILYLGLVTLIGYVEDQTKNVTGGPRITDLDYTGTGTYTMSITPTVKAAVKQFYNNWPGGTTRFNSRTKTITYTGTKEQINNKLDYLYMVPAQDYAEDITLTYTLTTPTGVTESKTQLINLGTFDNEIVGMNAPRYYQPVIPGVSEPGFQKIFAPVVNPPNATPYIDDYENEGDVYRIRFTCSFGKFGDAPETASYDFSFTGTKTQANDLFADLIFFPNDNYVQNGTFNYRQYKNNILQVNLYVNLNAPEVIFSPFKLSSPYKVPQTVNEGSVFTPPLAAEPVLFNKANVNLRYRLTFSAKFTAVRVTWPDIPAGCTVIESTQYGWIEIQGIDSIEKWNRVKNPVITLSNALSGTFNYFAELYYISSLGGSNSINWAIDPWTITNTTPLTNAISPVYYTPGQITNLSAYAPRLADEGFENPTWTMTITPSNPSYVTNMSSTGSGGPVSFNSVTKVYTIVGKQTDVNSHLNTLTITTQGQADITQTLTFSASTSNESDTKILRMISADESKLTIPGIGYYQYNVSATNTIISNWPQLAGDLTNPGRQYQVDITGLNHENRLNSLYSEITSKIYEYSTQLQSSDYIEFQPSFLEKELILGRNAQPKVSDNKDLIAVLEPNYGYYNLQYGRVVIFEKVNSVWTQVKEYSKNTTRPQDIYTIQRDSLALSSDGSTISYAVKVDSYTGTDNIVIKVQSKSGGQWDAWDDSAVINLNIEDALGIKTQLSSDGTKLFVNLIYSTGTTRTFKSWVFHKINSVWTQVYFRDESSSESSTHVSNDFNTLLHTYYANGGSNVQLYAWSSNSYNLVKSYLYTTTGRTRYSLSPSGDKFIQNKNIFSTRDLSQSNFVQLGSISFTRTPIVNSTTDEYEINFDSDTRISVIWNANYPYNFVIDQNGNPTPASVQNPTTRSYQKFEIFDLINNTWVPASVQSRNSSITSTLSNLMDTNWSYGSYTDVFTRTSLSYWPEWAVSADGQMLITSGSDRVINIYDLTTSSNKVSLITNGIRLIGTAQWLNLAIKMIRFNGTNETGNEIFYTLTDVASNTQLTIRNQEFRRIN